MMSDGTSLPKVLEYDNIWALKTDEMIEGLSWYWWWWIFFIENPDDPERPRQLMILWSTKYVDQIEVNDKRWSMKKLPTWNDGKLEFNGMTAAWWFDGEDMYDPIVLEEMDFEIHTQGKSGMLKPLSEDGDYRFFGSPDKYIVNIQNDRNDFHLEMTPWNDYLQKHRFNDQSFIGKYGYNIMKIYGMKLSGRIDGESVQGSSYFQRVQVNAPATPWYWGIVHCEDESFLHYFNPFIGPQMFRSKQKQTSRLDWGDIRLSRSIRFYHRGSDREFKFGTKHVDISHEIRDDLPVFMVEGEDQDKEISFKLSAYSRANWRFQEKRRFGMRNVFYYNEYPAELLDFEFRLKDGSLTVTKSDLGRTYGNFEHSWGKLL
ncbi:MAG: hypothetical protein ACOCTR_02935 [Candidatus Natronoplasma sp.]